MPFFGKPSTPHQCLPLLPNNLWNHGSGHVAHWVGLEKTVAGDVVLFCLPSLIVNSQVFLNNNSWREDKGNHHREGGLDMWFC